ncbi:SURF1 family protein [Bradyrhizobium sp. CNPSo 4026]|nr:SURF1 family protein [Bradyrhizobium cenepequi]
MLVALAALGVAALTALGVWQLERRTWKLALIDRVEQRQHAAPQPLPASWHTITASSDEYRRVTVTGHFLHGRETLIAAVTDYGRGFWVLTPLQTTNGATVLVNRGFIPPDRRDPSTRREGNPPGVVTVIGLLRITEPKGAFLHTNDPAANRWYSRDVAAIATVRGLSQVAPFFIDADASPNPGGYPIGGLTVVRFPNNHLIYALTWFAMAFMLAAALLRALRGRIHVRNFNARRDAVRSLVAAARSLSRKTGPDARAHIGSA